jgi:hypothetical protein
MDRTGRHGLQNHHIERALRHLGLGRFHLHTCGFYIYRLEAKFKTFRFPGLLLTFRRILRK